MTEKNPFFLPSVALLTAVNVLRTLENCSPVYKSCGSNTCKRGTWSLEPKTSHSGCLSSPHRGWQWGLSSPYVSAGEGCLFRADKSHFLYSKWIPGAPVADGTGRTGGPGSIWSVTLGTGKEEIGAVCRAGTPPKTTEKVIACLEGRKDFAAIFVIESWRDWGCPHTHTHIFSAAEETNTQNFLLLQYNTYNTFTFFYRKPKPVILCAKIRILCC